VLQAEAAVEVHVNPEQGARVPHELGLPFMDPRDLADDVAMHEEEDEVSSDDDQDAPALFAGRGPRGLGLGPVPIHAFLQMVAQRRDQEATFATNDQLLTHLRKSGALKTEDVARAMRVCPRPAFVPEAHAHEALRDTPVHLRAHGFNVSAPHMHATCLCALKIQAGHRFLDVGSGCGVLVAAAAVLVGPTGTSVGIDCKEGAVQLGRANVEALAGSSREFAAATGAISFQEHNVFVPSHDLRGKFDRIHVGAACPPRRLAALTKLIGPQGGMIVSPVNSELRLITVAADGVVSQKNLTPVRYSDLVIPSDCDAVEEAVEGERALRARQLCPPPSSFAEDAAAVLGPPAPGSPVSPWSNSSDSDGSVGTPTMARSAPLPCGGRGGGSGGSRDGSLKASGAARPWRGVASWRSSGTDGGGMDGEEEGSGPCPSAWMPSSVRRLLSACGPPATPRAEGGSMGSASSMSSTWAMMDGGREAPPPPVPALDASVLGPPDAELVGQGWSLPVHQAVMRERCEAWRARASSGMSDAGAAVFTAPDSAPRAAAAAFVQYCQSDSLDSVPFDAQGLNHLAAVLHLAIFFGCSRLVGLAEAALAASLQQPASSDFDPVEAAPALLALADDCNLPGLASAAADFCVTHHAQVHPPTARTYHHTYAVKSRQRACTQ